MKQRIRTVGIIRVGDSILMLKRNLGRMEMTPTWELPTGKIRLGEQPEETIIRSIYEYMGVKVESLKLMDVVTFVSLNNASRFSNLYIVYEVRISENEKITPFDRYVAYKYIKFDDIRNFKIEDASLSVLDIEIGSRTNRYSRETANSAIVYVDGGSRGNPGPSGIGYYIVGENGEVLRRGGKFIGFATSRVAEYFALKEGLEQALELGLKTVRVVGDSLMMINQMKGVYKVKNKDIMQIFDDIQELLKNFEAVSFTHVGRERNREADTEVNLAIDQYFGFNL